MDCVEHYVGLNRTPALPLAVRGWMALIQDGHCNNLVLISADQNAVVAFVGGEPAGVMTYRHDLVMKEFSVGLGYVLPAYRRLGLYGRLWDALVARAQAVGVPRISSHTFLGNAAMRAVARRQGRTETLVSLDFDVP